MYKYSPSIRGFYHDTVHDTFPNDCVDITDDEHAELMRLQSTGKEITPCPDTGKPLAVDRVVDSNEADARVNIYKQAALILEQHDLLRTLVLDPSNKEARGKLLALDKELKRLRSL